MYIQYVYVTIYNLPRTIGIIVNPEIPNPVKNLMAANMAKLYERALANPKKAVVTQDTRSVIFLPNL